MSKEEVNFANLDPRDRFEILAARHLRISLPSIESIRDRDDYRSTGVSDLWQFWQVIADAEVSEVDRLREELAQSRILSADQGLNLKRVKREFDTMKGRATDAEKRSSDLVELLRDIYNQNELSGFDDRRILAVIEPQSTVSGAIE